MLQTLQTVTDKVDFSAFSDTGQFGFGAGNNGVIKAKGMDVASVRVHSTCLLYTYFPVFCPDVWSEWLSSFFGRVGYLQCLAWSCLANMVEFQIYQYTCINLHYIKDVCHVYAIWHVELTASSVCAFTNCRV